jgi:hypothetical protein
VRGKEEGWVWWYKEKQRRECFCWQSFYSECYYLTLAKRHSLCPKEKGRRHRRSSPGLSLIVGGFSRLGGVAHGYLKYPSTLATVVVAGSIVIITIDRAVNSVVTNLATTSASIIAGAPNTFFGGQRRGVAIVVVSEAVVVAKAIVVVVVVAVVVVVVVVIVVVGAVHVAELAVDVVDLQLNRIDFHSVGVRDSVSGDTSGNETVGVC